ncbi:unnamed protein product [Kluyveromyces dobzhanskii CBS 2104]|uniref:WGS project CCBQ000000000 data, contig 00015 n=1 Tax=Kluyveromyces dobzhanskii CBS 2104 TaxID=1427455 RepID=A0A0A8L9W1_9SACH|nr:unnamed protein product [Kluyveromyces dobzhanskii CBS 2104]
MPMQQQIGASNAATSGMSFLMGDPVVRDARIRLDNKKSFCDDHMFYPETKFGWSTVASNTNATAYIPAGMNSYGLSTYNQRVSQHTNLGAGTDLADTNSIGLAGPVPHSTRHVYTGQNFSSLEQQKQQQQQQQTQQHVNPYLMSSNMQQSFNVNDTQPGYYGRGIKNGGNSSNAAAPHAASNKW